MHFSNSINWIELNRRLFSFPFSFFVERKKGGKEGRLENIGATISIETHHGFGVWRFGEARGRAHFRVINAFQYFREVEWRNLSDK